MVSFYTHENLPIGRHVPHTTPVVWLHGQVIESFHAKVDAKSITQKCIHDPLKTKKWNFSVQQLLWQPKINIIIHGSPQVPISGVLDNINMDTI